MYGLVNRAIEELVVSMHGDAGWSQVCAHARVEADGFVAMQAYDDDVTYRLVAAVSARTGLPAQAVLEAFGEYWVLYTAEQGYGALMAAGGASLREFLGNLNELHGRIETVFPHMRLPVFRVEDVGPGEYRLHYASSREGLAPMVIGIVRGLARRYGQRAEVRHEHAKTHVDEEDVFLVRELAA